MYEQHQLASRTTEVANLARTFSNLSRIGRGFIDVTVSAISLPMRKASSLLLPGR